MSRSLASFALFVGTLACQPSDRAPSMSDDTSRIEIRAQLDAYRRASAAVDADASAGFFTSTETLFEPGIPPIVTPDSIRAFIRSFPGVVVDSAMLRADTVEIFGAVGYVWGTYYERLRFPGQPESTQYGRFVMEWRRAADGDWRIERYYRVPLPAGWRDGPVGAG
jgi:ketosteroid isomerase-like protein